jgi:DNA repair protein RecO (recombination protein O)
MAARVSESFILRTYPFREADLIVSFFTREEGKLRGVARRARRPKSPFGAGLERLSHVRVAWFARRENAELVTLSGCELIESHFDLQADYGRGIALDYITEVAEQLLPPQEANEKFFRLMKSVLDYLARGGNPWAAVLYFTLWAVRLGGFLSELRVSGESAAIAQEMLVKPIAALDPREWSKTTAADLRRALIRATERHIERKFLTVPLLEAL